MPSKKNTTKITAVIQIGPRQFLVKEGDKLVVDKLDLKVGQNFKVEEVLLLTNGDKAQIGKPFVKGASVEIKLEDTSKGEKIRVARYKAKSRYRRVKGFRPLQSHLTITAITQK